MKSFGAYSNRFERKYVISSLVKAQIENEISAFCELDGYSHKEFGYKVSSLYYDSLLFHSFNEKLNGEKDRTKIASALAFF